jgi:endonuclease YncB( thermonuclease family)
VPVIICEAPRAVDGDTLRCANLSASVRLIGIDAPETRRCHRKSGCALGDPKKSTRTLIALLTLGPVRIFPQGVDRYGRTLARVRVAGLDVSCEMLARRAAVPYYSSIAC